MDDILPKNILIMKKETVLTKTAFQYASDRFKNENLEELNVELKKEIEKL